MDPIKLQLNSIRQVTRLQTNALIMHYKKKSKDDRANLALGLLNPGYKVFAMIFLLRIGPFIMTKLSDTQAGFRKEIIS